MAKYNSLEVNERVKEYAENSIFGFDFDPDLKKAARMNMVMAGDGHANVFHVNSLAYPKWDHPEEKAKIEDSARAAGKSVAAYMRAVGLGYELQSVIDSRLVLELAKVNADQGRLGGLLKMWLVSDKRLAGIEEEQLHRTIRVVLDRIGETQAALLELAKKA